MSIPVNFLLVNNSLCFLVGYVFNCILLWLLAKHATALMTAGYRAILLLSVLTDLVSLAVRAVVVPLLVADSGRLVLFATGPLVRRLPQPYAFAAIAVALFCFGFALFSLAVPFLYRYAFLCRGKSKWGLREFLAMLTVPFALTFGYVWLIMKEGYTRSEEEQREAWEFVLHRAANYSSENQLHNAAAGGANSDEHHAAGNYTIPIFVRDGSRIVVYQLGLMLVDYALVFFCGWRIYTHLMSLADGSVNGVQYRALQQQLSSALLLQSLIPLVVMSVPTVVISLASLAYGLRFKREVAAYKIAIDAWLPVLNPLIAIWVIKAYRQVVAAWMQRWWPSFARGLLGAAASATVHPATTPRAAPRSGSQQQQRQQQQELLELRRQNAATPLQQRQATSGGPANAMASTNY